MNLLHIATYYCRQKIYGNIIKMLSSHGYTQYIYCPVRTKDDINRNADFSIPNTEFFFPFILKKYYRLFYKLKLKLTLKKLESWISLTKIEMVHAHTLFSDGGIALRLKEKYNIPYIVAIRTTDITIFNKMINLRSFGKKILSEASAVIVINAHHVNSIKKYFADDFRKIEDKIYNIPNGINDFWHQNKGVARTLKGKRLNLIFVGSYIDLKNIPLIIQAALALSKEYEVTLKLVGGRGRGGVGEGDPKTLSAIKEAKSQDL